VVVARAPADVLVRLPPRAVEGDDEKTPSSSVPLVMSSMRKPMRVSVRTICAKPLFIIGSKPEPSRTSVPARPWSLPASFAGNMGRGSSGM